MATIGRDCEVIIDGSGYFLKPESYLMRQPRIRKATVRADGGESYVDLGPGKRVWVMVILCINELQGYDGVSTGLTGQQYRDALRTSYLNSVGNTILFVLIDNSTTVAVHFDNYLERVLDIHSQIIAAATGGSIACSYEVQIELIEA